MWDDGGSAERILQPQAYLAAIIHTNYVTGVGHCLEGKPADPEGSWSAYG
jgi:hypothetical protein